MSLKKYIFAGLIGIVSLGSCTYLDKEPDTEIDIDMVFENKTKVESWLANVYSRIPNPGNDWLNTYGWEVFADDLTASARWQQWDWPENIRPRQPSFPEGNSRGWPWQEPL